MRGGVVGTCLDMCPRDEFHEHDNYTLPVFEADPVTGLFRPDLAVKMFQRSAASKVYTPSEIRPLPVLQRTLDHLINYVIGERTGTTHGTTELNMYHYVRDRVRAIRTDITVQHLVSREVVEMLEKIALFYIWAAGRFHGAHRGDFDPIQNMEQITDNLHTIQEQFEELPPEDRVLEEEFRALNLLVFIADPAFYGRMMPCASKLLNSPHFQWILELRQCFLRRDLPGYLKVAAQMPIQFELFAVLNLRNDLWDESIRALRKGTAWRAFPKSMLLENLQLPEKCVPTFSECYGLEVEGDLVRFSRGWKGSDTTLPMHILPDRIEYALRRITCQQFMDLTSIGDVELSKPVPMPIALPVPVKEPESVEQEKETSNSEASEEESSSESESEEEQHEEPISAPSPKKVLILPPDVPQEKQAPPSAKKVSIRPLHFLQTKQAPRGFHVIRPNISIRAMIPAVIPPLCFSNVAIIASDDSESAAFARARLDDHVLCSEGMFKQAINVGDSMLFIVISKNIGPGTTAILHCNETEPASYDNIPCSTFCCTESNPYLRFNDVLRTTISKSIVEFRELDLTENVLKLTLGVLFECISCDYWYQASGNAVFSVINLVLDEIADAIESDYFISYLPPFEHKLMSMNDIFEFADVVRKLKLGTIEDRISKRPKSATWPVYVRENLVIQIQSFTAPICVKFSPEEFCRTILSKCQTVLVAPSETVDTGKPTFEDIIDEFDAALSYM